MAAPTPMTSSHLACHPHGGPSFPSLALACSYSLSPRGIRCRGSPEAGTPAGLGSRAAEWHGICQLRQASSQLLIYLICSSISARHLHHVWCDMVAPCRGAALTCGQGHHPAPAPREVNFSTTTRHQPHEPLAGGSGILQQQQQRRAPQVGTGGSMRAARAAPHRPAVHTIIDLRQGLCGFSCGSKSRLPCLCSTPTALLA